VGVSLVATGARLAVVLDTVQVILSNCQVFVARADGGGGGHRGAAPGTRTQRPQASLLDKTFRVCDWWVLPLPSPGQAPKNLF
jgi:hypothetical protein